ncbi:MAG TPA: class I SAM-dependent methyltransferase [Gaiellaceae bacterium]|nr:class I SAM-dependent methyltransferase [Gaiellaceae bacterium]
MQLRDAWERNAAEWVRWARTPGHDSYWRYHRDAFLGLVPPPGRLTLDIGCGEGRLARDLQTAGHRTIGVDSSPTLVEAARGADPGGEYVAADAADLPFPDGQADLAIAFMSLQDVDDMAGAVGEAARVLEPWGRFVLAVVHPINSAHQLDREHPERPLVMKDDYFDRRYYRDEIERDGLTVTFESRHWTLQDYFDAMLGAGLVVDALREIGQDEHPRWSRYPLFLHLRALRLGPRR